MDSTALCELLSMMNASQGYQSDSVILQRSTECGLYNQLMYFLLFGHAI